jgi:hypothetical protein
VLPALDYAGSVVLFGFGAGALFFSQFSRESEAIFIAPPFIGSVGLLISGLIGHGSLQRCIRYNMPWEAR